MTTKQPNYEKDYVKAANGLSRLTGMIEARAQIAVRDYKLNEAKDMYKDLISIHKDEPLETVSKQWAEEYRIQLEKVMRMQVEGQQLKLPLDGENI